MKNKIALALLVTFVSNVTPTIMFAQTYNSIDRIVTSESGEDLEVVPVLKIADEGDFDGSSQVFKIILDNAEFSEDFEVSDILVGGVALTDESKLIVLSSNEAIIEASPNVGEDIEIVLDTKLLLSQATIKEDDEIEEVSELEEIDLDSLDFDGTTYTLEGYTMVQVRDVVDAFSNSAQISWDDETKTAIIYIDGKEVSLTVGSNIMLVDGSEIEMVQECTIKEDRIYISVRDIGYIIGS